MDDQPTGNLSGSTLAHRLQQMLAGGDGPDRAVDVGAAVPATGTPEMVMISREELIRIRLMMAFPSSSGGGAIFTGVRQGTYQIGGGSISVNGKGQITNIVPGEDPLPPIDECYNIVHELADLPPPVGGVRTIPDGVTLVCGVITLPPGESIVVPDDTVLIGRDADLDGIIGDIDGPMINSAGNGIIVDRLFLRNTNVGSAAYCLRTTSLPFPNARVSRIGGDGLSIGGSRGVLVEDASTVDFFRILNRCDLEGITIAGDNFGISVFAFSHLPSNPLTSVGIFFAPGSNTGGFRLVDSVFPLFAPGSRSVEKHPAAAVNLAAFYTNSFIDTLGGSSNGLVGLSADGEISILFYANFGVAQSRNGGSGAYNGNPGSVQTVIPGVNTWVRVGNGNPGAHPLFSLTTGSARVNLVQPAGAETARVQYIGLDQTSVHLFASLSLRTVTLGTARAMAARLVLLPAGGGPAVPIDPAFTTVSAGLIAAGNSLSLTANLTLEPGDAIAVEVQNRTDGDNLIVDSVDFGFDGT